MLDPQKQERLERLILKQQIIIANLKTRNAQLEEDLRRLKRNDESRGLGWFQSLKALIQRMTSK